MAQTIDNSVEGRLAEVEAALRSLLATNLTDLASVTDASGRLVPLSALAFGQVAVRDLNLVALTTNSTAWVSIGPSLDVRVRGGRLRVDLAARLIVAGFNLRIGASYALRGPAATAADLATAPLRQAAAESRALLVKNQQGGFAEAAGGVPDLVEGLPEGWYRVTMHAQLSGEVNTAPDTYGNVSNRRLFATPL